MKDRDPKQSWNSYPNNVALIIASVVGGTALGVTLVDSVRHQNEADREQTTERVLNIVTNNIANGTPVNILEGGSAVIKLADGKAVKITNPILTKDGTAMEHARGAEAKKHLLTAYSEGNGTNTSASTITYIENGRHVTQEQAFTDSKPLVITALGELTTGNKADYFIAAPNQPFGGEPIAQGIAEHTVTVAVPGN